MYCYHLLNSQHLSIFYSIQGEWRMFQAVRKSKSKSEEDSETLAPPITQTRLRIQLLIPPERERVLILEGEVTRMIMPGGDTSSSDGWMMPNGGMLDGMLPKVAEDEGLLYTAGEAWMEDAEGGGNRRKVGNFSLMKLKAIKRENLIYTVDVSKPISNEGKEDDSE